MGHVILWGILLLTAAVLGVVYYKKNQKGTDAVVASVEKAATTVASDVKTTVAAAETEVKKA